MVQWLEQSQGKGPVREAGLGQSASKDKDISQEQSPLRQKQLQQRRLLGADELGRASQLGNVAEK